MSLAIAGAALLAACGTAPQIARPGIPKPTPTPQQSAGEAARAAMAAKFGASSLKAGDYRWDAAATAAGAPRLFIDLGDQMAYFYRGGTLVGAATVSSGKKGRESPIGLFPVLEKRRHHRSNKYDDAPMPYMQRLNWYGFALHGGHLPGYPASHGCIRLPMKFAAKLFEATSVGTPVVIED